MASPHSSSTLGLSHLLLGTATLSRRWAGEQIKSSWPYLAALGAGCLVGAGSVFLAQRMAKRVAHHEHVTSLSKELTSLHVTVRDLSQAVRELKEQQTQSGKKENKKLKSAMRSVTFSEVDLSFQERDQDDQDCTATASSARSTNTDFYSCVSEEEEFFDIPEEEVQEGRQLGEAEAQAKSESDVILELFRAADDLMEGSGGEQRKALRMLRARQEQLGRNSEFLWRLCKAIYLSAVQVGATSSSNGLNSPGGANSQLDSTDAACENAKRALINEAVAVGARAIQSDENSSEAHKW